MVKANEESLKQVERTHIFKLIKGCQKRQRESQKGLYQEFYAYGMSICIRYTNNRDEAAEILNDAFLKVFKNITQFDINRPFKPWLRTILINTAITFYHRKKKQPEWTILESIPEEKDRGEDILSGISYEEIIGLIQQLSPQYRTIFNLYVIEGYKHEEIAKILEISVGTSKSNLAKAKRNLRTLLKKFFLNEENG